MFRKKPKTIFEKQFANRFNKILVDLDRHKECHTPEEYEVMRNFFLMLGGEYHMKVGANQYFERKSYWSGFKTTCIGLFCKFARQSGTYKFLNFNKLDQHIQDL